MVERASTSGATLTVQALAEALQRPLALIRDPALLRPTESALATALEGIVRDPRWERAMGSAPATTTNPSWSLGTAEWHRVEPLADRHRDPRPTAGLRRSHSLRPASFTNHVSDRRSPGPSSALSPAGCGRGGQGAAQTGVGGCGGALGVDSRSYQISSHSGGEYERACYAEQLRGCREWGGPDGSRTGRSAGCAARGRRGSERGSGCRAHGGVQVPLPCGRVCGDYAWGSELCGDAGGTLGRGRGDVAFRCACVLPRCASACERGRGGHPAAGSAW
jgi:hypothetical protein